MLPRKTNLDQIFRISSEEKELGELPDYGKPHKIKRPESAPLDDFILWKKNVAKPEAERIQKSLLKEFETTLKRASNGLVSIYIKKTSPVAPLRKLEYDEGERRLSFAAKNKNVELLGVGPYDAALLKSFNKLGNPKAVLVQLSRIASKLPKPLKSLHSFNKVAFDLDRLEEGEAVLHPSDLLENLEVYTFAGKGDSGEARLVKRNDRDQNQWDEINVDSRTIHPANKTLEGLQQLAKNRESEFAEYKQQSDSQNVEETEELPSQDESPEKGKSPKRNHGQQPPVAPEAAGKPAAEEPEPEQEELDQSEDEEIRKEEAGR